MQRAAADLAADPTIREYTGPVDLLAPHLADVEALILHLAPALARRHRRRAPAAGRRVRAGRGRQPQPGEPDGARHPRLLLPWAQRTGRSRVRHGGGAGVLPAASSPGQTGIARGQWRLDLYSYDLAGPEFAGRTCGVIGFGGVGRAFAPIARGFGMRLLVHDPYVDAAVMRGARSRSGAARRRAAPLRRRRAGGAADGRDPWHDRGPGAGAARPGRHLRQPGARRAGRRRGAARCAGAPRHPGRDRRRLQPGAAAGRRPAS